MIVVILNTEAITLREQKKLTAKVSIKVFVAGIILFMTNRQIDDGH